MRRIVPLMLVQVVFLVGILQLLASRIFLGQILENGRVAANSSYFEFFRYLTGAFFETHLLVQISLLVILGIGALLIRDFVRIVTGYIKTFRN